jgi:hypothetical protein
MLNALDMYRKYGQQDRAEVMQDQQMMDQRQQREFSNNMAMVQMAQQQQARQQAMQQAAQQREQEMGWRQQQMGMNAQLRREQMSQAERIARERLGAKNAADAAKANKPLPPNALKLQNETLEELSIADSQEKDLAKLQDQIKSGKLELGFIANPVQDVRNYLGQSTESSRNYDTFKASLEKLRNDSLRLNKGVQTEGDSQRAWNEMLKNINDPNLVSERLDEIQQINSKAKTLKSMQLDLIRKNYGVDPLDTSAIQEQPANVGAGSSQSLTLQDRQALNWASQNPNDPRAAAIKRKLGIQ